MPMDVKEIRFYVLDVGQGACNYVEIVDSADKVIHNMLIDLGTTGSHIVAQQNIDWLKNQIKDRPDPRIDVIMLTHGDQDHYNLIAALFPALDPPSTARVTMVRYGGLAWKYRANKAVEKHNSLIKALERYCADVNGFTDLMSSYSGTTNTWTQMWPAVVSPTDAMLFVIVANAPHPQDKTLVKSSVRKPNGVAVNTKSIVYGVFWDKHWFVGTGDATAFTLNCVNNGVAGATIVPVPMMTLPHHGSRVTTYNLAAAEDDPDPAARKVAQDFLDTFKPWTITISANESGHFHPSLYMVDQFSSVTSSTVYWMDPYIDTETHYLTAFIDQNIAEMGEPDWPAEQMYATVQTDLNVYGTMYYVADWVEPYQCPPVPAQTPEVNDEVNMVPAPARGRNWQFTLRKDGDLTLTSWDNEHPSTTLLESFVGRTAAAPPSRTAAARLTMPMTAAPLPAMSRDGIIRRAGLAAALAAPRLAAQPSAWPRPGAGTGAEPRPAADPAGTSMPGLRRIP